MDLFTEEEAKGHPGHPARKLNGVLVNFTMPCDNSHFDDPSGYYDDSDGTWP
jgi:hypothetical protein